MKKIKRKVELQKSEEVKISIQKALLGIRQVLEKHKVRMVPVVVLDGETGVKANIELRPNLN